MPSFRTDRSGQIVSRLILRKCWNSGSCQGDEARAPARSPSLAARAHIALTLASTAACCERPVTIVADQHTQD